MSLGSLDRSVELRSLWRQDVEGEAAVLAGFLELGPELRPSVHLDAGDREGRFGQEFVEERCGGAGCGRGRDPPQRPAGDRIVGRDLLERLVGPDVHEVGVDLDDLAGPGRLQALRQPSRMALFRGQPEPPGTGSAT